MKRKTKEKILSWVKKLLRYEDYTPKTVEYTEKKLDIQVIKGTQVIFDWDYQNNIEELIANELGHTLRKHKAFKYTVQELEQTGPNSAFSTKEYQVDYLLEYVKR